MSKRSIWLLLQDILEALHNILSYTSELSFEEFIDDQKTLDAVVRNFEIIGEAANKLPKDFRDQNDQLDWSGIIGFRNILVHDYFGIDYEILWKIKSDNLSKLESEINILLNQI
jgi:uncharacterized protein with HEPN domain